MHVAFGRVRRKSRIGADYTDAADYRIGDGGRRLVVGFRFALPIAVNLRKICIFLGFEKSVAK